MSNEQDAWMPLWIGAYLADTTDLTRDQHGGYLLLLMTYWRKGKPLPDDDRRLASITKATLEEWREELRPVLAEFFQVADGVWRHKRVDAELETAAQRAEEASKKGKNAANARWKKEPKQGLDASALPAAMPAAMPDECSEQCSEHAASNAPDMLEQCPTPSPSPIYPPPPMRVREPGSCEVFPIEEGWGPSPAFEAQAKLMGVAVRDAALMKEGLSDFIAFWLARPNECRTQAEWDHALAKSLKYAQARAAAKPAIQPTGSRRPAAPVNTPNHGAHDVVERA